MKRLLFTLLLLAITVAAFSQTISFGFKGGFNLSEQSHSNPSAYGSSLLQGFNAGGILDLGFQNFSIQPGIFFSTKGEKDGSEFAGLNGNVSSKTVLSYIEIPVNFLYKSKIAKNITLNLGGGPYIGYGTAENLTINNNEPYDYGSGHHFAYRNPDYGINFVAGIEVHKFIIDAGYGLGLANIALDGTTIKNRVASLSVGYLFR
jgi:hypothetical protein